ncbi:hypothetical protein AADG42_08095 [Ammonicoccus fulvus]|uniref:Uncharacterized protein n=1 Tax=Ammonicoccus fulvus TaxID=3138240 RepID=A0ABZ3FR80_9ACTN
MSRFLRRWAFALVLLGIIIGYLAVKSMTGDPSGMVWVGVLLPAVFIVSPLFFPSRRARRDHGLEQPDRVAIYFRPGDVFSIRLRLALGNVAKRALWIDAVADPAAEAWVREVNRGDLLTPTVVIGDEIKRNPNPHWVGRHLVEDDEQDAAEKAAPDDSD